MNVDLLRTTNWQLYNDTDLTAGGITEGYTEGIPSAGGAPAITVEGFRGCKIRALGDIDGGTVTTFEAAIVETVGNPQNPDAYSTTIIGTITTLTCGTRNVNEAGKNEWKTGANLVIDTMTAWTADPFFTERLNYANGIVLDYSPGGVDDNTDGELLISDLSNAWGLLLAGTTFGASLTALNFLVALDV